LGVYVFLCGQRFPASFAIAADQVRGVMLYPIGGSVKVSLVLHREGAIDRLIRLYKEVVPETHGYLTRSGEVDLPRVQLMLNRLGEVEDGIFKKRREDDLDFRQRQKNKRARQNSYSAPKWVPQGQFAPRAISETPSPVQNPRQEAYKMRRQRSMNEPDAAVDASNKNAAQDLRHFLKKDKQLNISTSSVPSTPTPEKSENSRKRRHSEMEEDEDANDDVR